MSPFYLKILSIFFFLFCVGYGVYVATAAMTEIRPFNKSYKRIDFIKTFGNFGRLFYIIFGMLFAAICFAMVLKIWHQGG